MTFLSPPFRSVTRSYFSCGISQRDFSCTFERDKPWIDAPQRRRLVSRPGKCQQYHSHALHSTQGQAPGRDITDTGQPSLNPDNSGECWKEKEEVLRLRPNYIPILPLYIPTVHTSHMLSFSPLLLVVVHLWCFHLAKLIRSFLPISNLREAGSRVITGKAGTDNIGLLPYRLMSSRCNPRQCTLHQSRMRDY